MSWMFGALIFMPTQHVTVPERQDDMCYARMFLDENRDSPERDMVNPSSEDSYMWPIRGAL